MKIKAGWKKVLAVFTATVFILPAVSLAIEAGVGVRDYTPDPTELRVPLGGYGARGKKPATGVHDPVFVKALALRDGENLAVVNRTRLGHELPDRGDQPRELILRVAREADAHPVDQGDLLHV